MENLVVSMDVQENTVDDKVIFQMDDEGNHRIICGNSKGDWSRYEGISILKLGVILYIGVTEYFEGYLPTERPLVVAPATSFGSEIISGIRPE